MWNGANHQATYLYWLLTNLDKVPVMNCFNLIITGSESTSVSLTTVDSDPVGRQQVGVARDLWRDFLGGSSVQNGVQLWSAHRQGG